MDLEAQISQLSLVLPLQIIIDAFNYIRLGHADVMVLVDLKAVNCWVWRI
jgi:hypothetical protein